MPRFCRLLRKRQRAKINHPRLRNVIIGPARLSVTVYRLPAVVHLMSLHRQRTGAIARQSTISYNTHCSCIKQLLILTYTSRSHAARYVADYAREQKHPIYRIPQQKTIIIPERRVSHTQQQIIYPFAASLSSFLMRSVMHWSTHISQRCSAKQIELNRASDPHNIKLCRVELANVPTYLVSLNP